MKCILRKFREYKENDNSNGFNLTPKRIIKKQLENANQAIIKIAEMKFVNIESLLFCISYILKEITISHQFRFCFNSQI